MIKVVELTQTCSACPSQWSGVTEDGRDIYVRYRWGHLWISWGVTGDMILSRDIGESAWDGLLTYEELVEQTRGIISWP